VIRLPVNLDRFRPAPKRNYLLFLGRISPWKGVFQSAAFAAAVNRHLVLAGPAWEQEYLDMIVSTYGAFVSWRGEVGGDQRQRLLAEATAVMVLSQPVDGPWGGKWIEPGAMVVAEAAASGTPVIATSNGCLAEIAQRVGVIVDTGILSIEAAQVALASLPSSDAVRRAAADWNHVAVANEYLELYHHVVAGTELPT
jgi:glycosyltransferase involved in cell wall biosynthesis